MRLPPGIDSANVHQVIAVPSEALGVPELAGRLYVPKLYPIESERAAVIELLEHSVEASGGRLLYSSFRDQLVAPIYLGAEDTQGGRYESTRIQSTRLSG